MKTNIMKSAFMAKKSYTTPICEVLQIDTEVILATVGEASKPDFNFAPERRPGHGSSQAPVF